MLGLVHPTVDEDGSGLDQGENLKIEIILDLSQCDSYIRSIMYTNPQVFIDAGGLSENYFRISKADILSAQRLCGPPANYSFAMVNGLGSLLDIKIDIYHARDTNLDSL